MRNQTARRYRSWQSLTVDEVYNPGMMKHISAHTDLQSEWIKCFAWLPKRSDITNEWIWLTSYYEYVITMDMNGAVPKKGKDWRLIYTRSEYIQKKLQGEIIEASNFKIEQQLRSKHVNE